MSAFGNILKHLEAKKPVDISAELLGSLDLIKLSVTPNDYFFSQGQKTSPWVYKVVLKGKVIFIDPTPFYTEAWSFLVKAEVGQLQRVYYNYTPGSTLQLVNDLYGQCKTEELNKGNACEELLDVFSHILKEYGRKNILHELQSTDRFSRFKIVTAGLEYEVDTIRILRLDEETVQVCLVSSENEISLTEYFSPDITVDKLKEHSNLIGPSSRRMSENDRMRFFTELKKLIVKYSKEAA